MKCPRCQQENPSQAHFCMGCGAALPARARAQKARVGPKLPVSQRKAPKKEGGRVRDLEKRLTEALAQLQTRDRELGEALDQQTAARQNLRVISGSPTDAQPVFDAIVASAARLCSADDGWIVLVEGAVLRAVSATGQLVAQMPIYNARRLHVTRESVIGRSMLDRATLHIADLAAESEAEVAEDRALQRMVGHRNQLR